MRFFRIRIRQKISLKSASGDEDSEVIFRNKHLIDLVTYIFERLEKAYFTHANKREQQLGGKIF